jgi:hypothetical protein
VPFYLFFPCGLLIDGIDCRFYFRSFDHQTNARIAKYVDPTSTVWNKTTTAGATIKTALDFALTLSAAASGEAKYVEELYPNIAAVGSVYGDVGGKYVSFLKQGEATFMGEPYILWNQPFALDEASGKVTTTPAPSAVTQASTTKAPEAGKSGAISVGTSAFATVFACISVLALEGFTFLL